ncbi:hypothetical protein CAPI_05995 [Corynebacterium capitovis DSM 44611]|nr:hypothetical protein CAPI_05995 [Corynebacterium capitovis DSM 44611]
MKARLTAGVLSVALLFGAAPAAHAHTEAEPERDSTPSVSFYSTMTDFLSCKLYPTRPWCPTSNAPR